MSRRGRDAVKNNEHPVTYWEERMVMKEEEIAKLLIYMGNHHVGSTAKLTPFFRLPDKDDPEELMRIYDEFHKVSAKKLNFARIMSMHLQKEISEKGKIPPTLERPRKKRKRLKYGRKKRGSRKRNKIIQRKIW